MTPRIIRGSWLLLSAIGLSTVAAGTLYGQQPVVLNPVVISTPQPVPASIVGYTAEPRGLFGQRVVARPVFATSPISIVPAMPPSSAIPVSPAAPANSISMYKPVTVPQAVAVSPPSSLPAPVVLPPSLPARAGYSSYYAPPPALPIGVLPAVPPPTASFIPPSWTY